MTNFDYDNIDNSTFKTISEFMRNPDYSVDSLRNKSMAISGFYEWLRAINEYQAIAKA